MYYKSISKANLGNINQAGSQQGRYLNPEDISLPQEYKIEVFTQGLDSPSCMVFTDEGDILIGLSGYISRKPAVVRLHDGSLETVAQDFDAPISGINYRDGVIYVTHKGKVTSIRQNGIRQDILLGLPDNGDYWNSNVAFDSNGKIYLAIAVNTNSAVVGTDNYWIFDNPYNCDYPGAYVILNGQNYESRDVFIVDNVKTHTGAFSPFGVPNIPFEVRKGIEKASGSIIRLNPDGTQLEQYAWGLRYIPHIGFDQAYRLFASNQGFEVRGSRPIANAPDEFQLITQGIWYGWPDFAGGMPVTLPRFKPEGVEQPEFLLTNHPNVPPSPFATFTSGSYITGFDFNKNYSFGNYGDAFVTEFGSGGRIAGEDITAYAAKGHRISQINISTGAVSTFAINKSGFPSSITREGGFERPIDLVFGPDGAMYILDLGMNSPRNPSAYFPNTGVIWKVTRIAL